MNKICLLILVICIAVCAQARFVNSTGVDWDIRVNANNALVVAEDADVASTWQTTSSTTPLTTTTAASLHAAQAAGVRNYVKSLSFQNTNTTSTLVEVLDGSTVIAIFNCPPSAMLAPVTVTFQPALRGSAATTLNIQAVTTGASVYYNAQGFVGQ